MIYEDELNPKIASMMKGMNFMPEMGLGKDQQGLAEFIEPKVPISKHGLRFQKVEKAREPGGGPTGRKLDGKLLWRKVLIIPTPASMNRYW